MLRIIAIVPKIQGGCLRDGSNRKSPMDRWHWATYPPHLSYTYSNMRTNRSWVCVFGAVVVPNIIVSINSG